MRTQQQIKDHKEAARLLNKIKDITFSHISATSGISEYEIQQFILGQYSEYGMVTDKDWPIVSFNSHCAIPEYYPQPDSDKLADGTLVMIDLWAKLDKPEAPFADITWMGYYGKEIPEKIQSVFALALEARKQALEFIQKTLDNDALPIGKEIDDVVRKVIFDAGFESNILHNTGHSLGIVDDHGTEPNIDQINNNKIEKNLGYTIEPGIYLPGEFGIRSEMDFYVSEDNQLVITTELQEEMVKL